MGTAGVAAGVTVRGVSKTFGGTRALHGIDLEIAPGEVHGLVGANGSGKSTLIRILAGAVAPDPGGALGVAGEAVGLPLRPDAAQRLGFAFVHQDLALIGSVSVAENVLLPELAAARGAHLGVRRLRRRATAALAELGVRLDPRGPVGALPPVDRALVAVARALAQPGPRRLLVLDEVTAALSADELPRLSAAMRRFTASGGSVLFVSHDVDEVRALTDRVTVLRDGRAVLTVHTVATTAAELVTLISGAPPVPRPPSRAEVAGRVGRAALRVTDLAGGRLTGLTLTLRAGEVVGLTGQTGSGFAEVLPLLFGARRARGGSIGMGGRTLGTRAVTPSRARRAGLALLPRDRAAEGCAPALPVADNMMLPVLDDYTSRLRRLRTGALAARCAQLLAAFDVRPPEPGRRFSTLSGGNQQKALAAKWLSTGPAVLLLDEPARGVDVGARAILHDMIIDAAAAGAGVLVAGTDHDELAALCDRVIVFSDGLVSAELAGGGLTRESLTAACLRRPER